MKGRPLTIMVWDGGFWISQTVKKVIYHNGRWHGFNSAFARLTDEKVTIIILTINSIGMYMA
jgi:predicted component of type VI protein secretion system